MQGKTSAGNPLCKKLPAMAGALLLAANAAAEFYLGTLLRDSRLDIRAGSHLNVDDLAHLDAVVIPAPGEDDRKDAPFLRRFAERGGTVVYVVDTEEKRQTDAVRVPGAAVVGSYGEVVKAIFNTEEDK